MLHTGQDFSDCISMLLLALEGGCLLWALGSRPAYTYQTATAGDAPPLSADPETRRGPWPHLGQAESDHWRAGHRANGGRHRDVGPVGGPSGTQPQSADATAAVAACGHA